MLILTLTAAERSAPNTSLPCPTPLALQGSLLSASPDPPHPNTLSPTPLLPDPHSAVSSKRKPKASYICSTEKNHYSLKTRSIQAVSSPLSLTSTGSNTAEVKHPHTYAALNCGFSFIAQSDVQTVQIYLFIICVSELYHLKDISSSKNFFL